MGLKEKNMKEKALWLFRDQIWSTTERDIWTSYWQTLKQDHCVKYNVYFYVHERTALSKF